MAFSMAKLVINLVVFCLAVCWAVGRQQKLWRDLSWALFVVAGLAALECLTGFWRFQAAADSGIAAVHRWSGHGLVIVFWCLNVAMVGAGIATIRRRPFAAIGAVLLFLAYFLLVLVESFTGYLPPAPEHRGPAAEETMNRFYVLHCAFFPLSILLGMPTGALVLRRLSAHAATIASDTETVQRAPFDNPYSPPAGD